MSDDQPEINVDAYLSEAITALELVPPDDATRGTLEEYAQRLDMCRRIIATTSVLRNHMELALAEAMPENVMVEGGMRIVRERANRSYWKDSDSSARMREDIERQVATKLSTDVATGEVDAMRRNVISHAIHELWEVLPAPSALKAGARKFDIRLSDYREFTPGYSIRISPIEEEPTDA